MRNMSVNKCLVFLAVLTSSLCVAVDMLSNIHLALLILTGFSSALLLLNRSIDKQFVFFLGFFSLPFLLSLIFSLPFNYFYNTKFNYGELAFVGRIVMLSSTMAIITYIHKNSINDELFFQQVLKFYFFSCGILVFSGVWQILDVYLGFPIKFPFETRAHIHSASEEVRKAFGLRVTGFAEEPSYIAPFLNEFLILCIFLITNKRWKII